MSESRDVGDTIGYQLRWLRGLHGLTQEELADRANVSRDLARSAPRSAQPKVRARAGRVGADL